MGKAKKGLADENEEGFIMNESGNSVTVDHVDGEDEKAGEETDAESKSEDEKQS